MIRIHSPPPLHRYRMNDYNVHSGQLLHIPVLPSVSSWSQLVTACDQVCHPHLHALCQEFVGVIPAGVPVVVNVLADNRPGRSGATGIGVVTVRALVRPTKAGQVRSGQIRSGGARLGQVRSEQFRLG